MVDCIVHTKKIIRVLYMCAQITAFFGSTLFDNPKAVISLTDVFDKKHGK